MITQASETVDFVWERQNDYAERDGTYRWVDRHVGYDSEAEARDGISRFLLEWPARVDAKYRSFPPRRFRISRIETHVRHLAVVDTSEGATDGS